MDLKILPLFVIACVVSTQDTDSNIRIVGGRLVDIRNVPFQISLSVQVGKFLYHTCGGSILNQNTILTAAHCVSNGGRFYVRAGSNSMKDGGQLVEVSKAIIHPQNDPESLDSDIAILKLKQNLVFNGYVKPVRMADSEKFYQPGVRASISGWGAVNSEGPLSERLLGVAVPIVNHEVCAKIYAELNNVTERMFCAGYLGVGGKDSCQGDSGGPLVVSGDVLTGVVSWGYNCADPLFPGVYVKVLAFRSWIDSLLK